MSEDIREELVRLIDENQTSRVLMEDGYHSVVFNSGATIADALMPLVARIQAQALREAATEVREEMGADEKALHDIRTEAELPQLSRVMLNGATRFAVHLRLRADRLEQGDPS